MPTDERNWETSSIILTLDGLSGTGKTTVSAILASAIGAETIQVPPWDLERSVPGLLVRPRTTLRFLPRSLQLVSLFEYSDQLTGRLKDAVRDFEQTRGSLIEIVGLLAAVLALIIAGTQMAINVRVATGAGLLMVVGGVLQFSFLGYSMLLGRGVRLGRVLITAGIALALLSGGVFFVLRF